MNDEQMAELRALFNATDIIGILKSRTSGERRAKQNKCPQRIRARQRWIDRVRDDFKLLGIKDAEQMAKDKEAMDRCDGSGGGSWVSLLSLQKKKINKKYTLILPSSYFIIVPTNIINRVLKL